MNKHTPGPWVVCGPLTDHGCTIVKVSPDINVISISGEFCYRVEVPANAHLIAAAPLLLDACKQAREFLKTIAHNTDDMDALDAAIAAAEGEA